MAFYIYQNIPNRKVTIHVGECSFCNQGHGLQQNILGIQNGQWLIAPDRGFISYETAAIAAQEIAIDMGIQFSNCQRCNPQL